ncbi:SPOR domain-containing protein [Thiogranum longum]|nr:outer membrane protein assembly factor BamD [Thiogranum longum]
MNHIKANGLRLLAFAGLLLASVSIFAAGVIDTVSIDDSRNPATIRVEFNVPMQYVTHAPERRGDELLIELRALSNGLFSLETFSNELQTVVAERDTLVPLIEARYDPLDTERGTLTLRFSREVSYKLYPGSDRRHLRLEVVTNENIVNKPAVLQPESSRRSQSKSSPEANYTEHYVINLESSLRDIAVPSAGALPLNRNLTLYTTKFPIDGRVWSRLRAGFFETRAQARAALKKVKSRYPGAWVDYASASEITAALKQAGGEAVVRKLRVPGITPTLPKTPDEKIAELMEQARQSMAKNDINHAIQLYTKILRYPDNPYRQDALEFLGVARERKGQLAHAVREYKRYLALYPDGEDADRIAQRLAGITTAKQASREPTGRKRRSSRKPEWDIYGGVSQFYRRDESTTDAAGDVVTQSSLSTDLDITARKRGERYDIQSRFTGSYLYDFLSDGPGDSSSISSLYADINHKSSGLSARLGRQSRNTGGVLGRFDGLLAGYQLNDRILVNVVAGFPVLSTRDQLKTERYLYGISADLGTFANAWDFNVFLIEQQNDGVLDRRAVGGEARYFDPRLSLLSFVDYDISYSSLNTLILLGTWTLPDRTTINASIDYRNSPILTTSNALQGQTVPDMNALQDIFTDDEIRDLAEDRTADSTSITLGAAHPLTDKYQISGDITLSKLSDTRASGGVDEIPGTDYEFFYNLQFIGSNLLMPGDVSVAGLRYSDTTSSHIASLSLNSRFPFRKVWRVNPRMRVDYRDNTSNNSTQWIAAPSMRIDYRWRKRYRFETEFGGEWSTQDLPNDTQDTSSFFFNLGYRADF